MQDPIMLCRPHLLGSHVELHKLVGHLIKQRSITGWIQNNCLEISSIQAYHAIIVEEMKRRGYRHDTPLPSYNSSYLPLDEQEYKINKKEALKDLLNRCNECLLRFLQ